MICLLCNYEGKNISKHLWFTHHLKTKEYYDSCVRKENEGYCKICGKETRFISLNFGYTSTYCSNQCHGKDIEAQKIHSFTLKNRTKEQKEETRKKQIATWENNLGPEWSKIISKRGFDSYDKRHGTNGGPFSSKLVRMKCEKTWGNSSPACNDDTKEKISNSLKEISDEQTKLTNAKTLKKYKEKFPNLIAYDGKFLTYECPDCNKISSFQLQFLQRRYKRDVKLCPYCNKVSYNKSHIEKELTNYIKTIYIGEIIENDKKILEGKELDILLPEMKLAFEFDGTYWHMDSRFHEPDEINCFKKLTAKEIWDYDKEKDILCEHKGITLIHIKEYDWINDNEKIKSYIKEKLLLKIEEVNKNG